MKDPRVRRALVSVYDKRGIVDLCRSLHAMQVEILSSGGTAKLLEDEGLPVLRVADYTGFPEMLDGRVKTLHPRIHAGILAVRANQQHMAQLAESGIEELDLVVVNLYPFEKTAGIAGIGLSEVVEMIDVGGPTLVRAAAKNYADVGVVVRPEDYEEVVQELEKAGGLSLEMRHRLAVRAFRHTAAYDLAVYGYLERVGPGGPGATADSPALPDRLELDLGKVQDLRYGENPHQRAAFYRELAIVGPSIGQARQLQGKPLSFNNILDFDAALGLAVEFREVACAIIKHGNPCGVGVGPEPLVAFQRALQCDPESAFGGVIAFNRNVDRRTALAVGEQFYEGVLAPEFDPEAREALASRKNLRVLAIGDGWRAERGGFDLRRVAGGLLVQEWDRLTENVREAKVATRRAPTDREWEALEFAWIVARHVKSNAIVYAQADRTIGIGAGQMSRVDSARFGVAKARQSLEGAVMASDAFFPFRDGVDVAAEAGVHAVIQPGGSIRDAEVISAADEHGMAMVLTGRRHFRH